MKTIQFASFLALSLVAAAGCGESSSNTPDASVKPDAAAMEAPTCAAYCTAVMGACTGGDAQYGSMEACMGSCKGFPVGMAADTSGNTVGCRTYHAGVAAGAGMAATHCPHAGPTGGGACGTACEAFCGMEASACTGANAQFTDAADCATKCATIAAGTGAYNTSHTSDNSLLCRTYHLSVAATDEASAMTHCSHTGVTSPVCAQ